jgi:probable F420-dependent oxidoreductase
VAQVKVGAVIPYWFDRPADEAFEIALEAERCGLEELWVGEMTTYDSFALAAAVARETSDITLVCGPLAAATRDVAGLALGLATVTDAGRRLAHVALGASTPIVVEAWHGRGWTNTVRRVTETVEALRGVLAGERADFRGTQVRCEGFRLRAALPGAQVCVAAFGPHMLRAAARVADRVVVNLLTPTQVARVRSVVGDVPIVAWVPAAYAPGEASLAQLRRQLGAYVPQPGYAEMFAEAGFGDVVEAMRGGARFEVIPDGLISSVALLGDENDLRSGIRAYAEAGATMVAVVPSTATDAGGEKVLRAVAGPV